MEDATFRNDPSEAAGRNIPDKDSSGRNCDSAMAPPNFSQKFRRFSILYRECEISSPLSLSQISVIRYLLSVIP
jgi:hypothetical protein